MFSKKALGAVLAVTLMVAACGQVKEELNKLSNDMKVQGHWLVRESEHSSKVEKMVEKESMVLTFKDDQAAFAPTDSIKGQVVFAALSECTKGPRPFKTEKSQLVFTAYGKCPEKRVTVQQIDQNTLKFPDPEDNNITRTFIKIDENQYLSLVKPSDRKL